MREQVEELIDFIVSLVNDEFDYKLDFVDARYYFINGGCLLFALILKHYLPESHFVINEKLNHIAISYDNEIYDATGKIEDTCFMEVSLEYMRNYQEHYGLPEIEISKNFTLQSLIQEIDSCSGNPIFMFLNKIHNRKILCKNKKEE